MLEPRGHADMYGCFLTDPVSDEADFGVVFMHNEGFSTMCGHGIIGVTTAVIETGMWPVTGSPATLRIDTPAGLVTATAQIDDGRVTRVAFQNVPSFVLDTDCRVNVEGVGSVGYDLAFGGAFYAYVNASVIGVPLDRDHASELARLGRLIKTAVIADRPVLHPVEPDLSFLYGVVFVGPPVDRARHSRNVCVFADGEVDRSPTGTSVSARLALLHHRGDLEVGTTIAIESIIGSVFEGRILQTTTFGEIDAIIPEVGGSAHLTGRHTFLIDPQDPLVGGFRLR